MIGLTVSCTGSDIEATGILVMSHSNRGIRAQGNLTLVGVLMEGELLFVGVGRARRTGISRISGWIRSSRAPRQVGSTCLSILLVGFFQEGEVMIEGLQIEGAVDVQVAVAVDGITQRDTVVTFRAAHPRIAGIIGGIGIHPLQIRQLIQRQLVAECGLLLVIERRTQVLDTVPH